MSDYSVVNGKLTWFFAGKIDTARAQELEQQIEAQIELAQPGAVVFDLSEVTYISSYFLRICLKRVKAVGTGNFAVVKVKRSVRTIFKIAGLDHLVGG